MTITIIGWYGTETLGDRAILAGCLHVLSKVCHSYSVLLGALNPILTERTILEDLVFYEKCAGRKLDISVFNSLSEKQLRRSISNSDAVMIGGGPLMDIQEMYMLEYAMGYARKKHRKCLLFGCGWGPLKQIETINIAESLVMNSDLTIFRDAISERQFKSIAPHFKTKVTSIIDPAFIACCVYRNQRKDSPTNAHIAINFRDIAVEADHYSDNTIEESIFSKILVQAATNTHLPILLIPMHSFAIGGDDRIVLSRIAKSAGNDRIAVQHIPTSLEQTMETYYNAQECIGMRFHSILLQTVLNGRNYIVDYTHPKEGKIIGLMEQLGMNDFYSDRYYSIHEGGDFSNWFKNEIDSFDCISLYDKYIQKYIEALKIVFN